MTAWQRHDDVAVVESDHRIAVVNLAALDQPPVVMTGSASLVYAAVDGIRDTAGVLAALESDFPDEPDLEQQARDCLKALEQAGLIASQTSTSP